MARRGKKLVSTDELVLQRNERERARVAAAADKPIPHDPPPAPDPPPVDLPFLGSRQAASVPSLAEFAMQHIMAEVYSRMAKDAGMLNVGVSEAQAKVLVMRGFEMGVAPLRALSELYLAPTDHGGSEIVEEATLIRARVAHSGLGVIEPLPEHCNETVATIRAIRKDHLGRRETLFRYTLEDATHDGLMLKANWQSGANREALLVARATTKAARAWFSDVEGPRYTPEELGGGGGGRQEAAPPHPGAVSPPPPSSSPAPVAPSNEAGIAVPVGKGNGAAGASDAAGPHPAVAPPPGAAADPTAKPPSPPPPQEPVRPGPNATRQEKMAHYADTSRAMHRPWTVNVGMSRDAQPVPIISHGVRAEQITEILNYTVAGRTDFARADEALTLVIDHLGQRLSIDTALLPAPYCFFALTETEAKEILEGLDVFARGDAQGEMNDLEQKPGNPGYATESAPDPRTVVQDGQKYSWVQANDYFEAVLRRLAGHATRGDAMGMLHAAYPTKEFYELTPDELFSGAADLDRLGANPTILKQAIDRLKMTRGG